MPSIDDFNKYTQEYTKKVLWIGVESIKGASDSGAEYMRGLIEANSPTGTKWHKKKSPNGGRVTTGLMLNSVDSTKVALSKSEISSNFGWVKNREEYFLDQDSGGYWHTAYGKPSGIGMGLLNTARDGGGKGTLRVLGAYQHASNDLIERMKKAGFSVSKDGGEVF